MPEKDEPLGEGVVGGRVELEVEVQGQSELSRPDVHQRKVPKEVLGESSLANLEGQHEATDWQSFQAARFEPSPACQIKVEVVAG